MKPVRWVQILIQIVYINLTVMFIWKAMKTPLQSSHMSKRGEQNEH